MDEMTIVGTLAARYRAAVDKTERAQKQAVVVRAEWIEATLELGEVILQARKQYPDTNEYSRWLVQNDLRILTPSEITALAGFARDPVAGRKMLQDSVSYAWRTIWEKQRKRDLRPPSGFGKGPPTPHSRRSGHVRRQKAQRIPDVMKEGWVRPVRPVVAIKGLTRQEVDPDFKGNAIAFAAEYGPVNLHTKAEIDQSRQQDALQKELAVIASLIRAAEAWLALPTSEALPNWLEKPGKAARMRGWYEILTRAAERLRTDAVLEEKMKSWSKSANDDLGEIPF